MAWINTNTFFLFNCQIPQSQQHGAAYKEGVPVTMVCDKHCQVLYLIMILNIFLKFVLIESSIPILLHYQLQGRWSKFDSIRFLSYSLAQKKSKLKGNTIRHYGISCQSDFKEKQNIWRVFSCGRMQRISNLLIKNQRLLTSYMKLGRTSEWRETLYVSDVYYVIYVTEYPSRNSHNWYTVTMYQVLYDSPVVDGKDLRTWIYKQMVRP